MVSRNGMPSQWAASASSLNAKELLDAWCKVFVPNRVRDIVVEHHWSSDLHKTEGVSASLRLYTGVTVKCLAVDQGLAALIRMLSDEVR